MDQHGIRMHVLTLDGGMPWQWVSAADGARLARMVNDAAAEAHRRYPTRFLVGIELPIRYPDLALQELNRMAGTPAYAATSTSRPAVPPAICAVAGAVGGAFRAQGRI
jgi:predicted TIM-barrel fold metal-dependent hydrolase